MTDEDKQTPRYDVIDSARRHYREGLMSRDLALRWIMDATGCLPIGASDILEREDWPENAENKRLTILINRNLGMTPGKVAAQAVHAALAWYGIDQGAVVVLHTSPTKLKAECDLLNYDAGRTEVAPGSLTAGIRRDSDR